MLAPEVAVAAAGRTSPADDSGRLAELMARVESLETELRDLQRATSYSARKSKGKSDK